MSKVKLLCVQHVSYFSKQKNKQVEGTKIFFVDPNETPSQNQAGMMPHELYTAALLFDKLHKKVGQDIDLVYDTSYYGGKPQLYLVDAS